jgi:hypothetical protein
MRIAGNDGSVALSLVVPSKAGFILSLMVVALLSVAVIRATPLAKYNGHQYAWPATSTINVFIRTDPDGYRTDWIKEAIERWTDRLATRGYTLKVTIGTPGKNDTGNIVNVTWAADGTSVPGTGGKTIGTDNSALATYSAGADGAIDGGSIVLGQNQLTSGALQTMNIAEHEFTHVLGLGDHDTGVVTKHDQGPEDRAPGNEWNDQDEAECNMLYPIVPSPAPEGEAEKVAGGVDDGLVTYEFTFVPGNPEHEEHVALITIGIPAAYVLSVTPRDGWLALSAAEPVPWDHEFFTTDQFMIEGSSSLPVWAPWSPPKFPTLRVSPAEAVADSIPDTQDPALSSDTPGFQVTIHLLPGLADCNVPIWAGYDLQVVPGPL